MAVSVLQSVLIGYLLMPMNKMIVNQLQKVAYFFDSGYKVTIDELVNLDERDLEYLMLNFGKEMAQILKYGETRNYEGDDDDDNYQEHCTACGDDIFDKTFAMGKYKYCYTCYINF